MIKILNLSELYPTMRIALDKTTERLLNKLVEIIQKEIYDSYQTHNYERTYQFRDSWEKTEARIRDTIIESEIWQDYNKMIWDSEKRQHGIDRPAREEELAQIFNSGLPSGSSDITYFPRRFDDSTHFWDEFVAWSDAHIDNIFKAECKKVGLNVSKNG